MIWFDFGEHLQTTLLLLETTFKQLLLETTLIQLLLETTFRQFCFYWRPPSDNFAFLETTFRQLWFYLETTFRQLCFFKKPPLGNFYWTLPLDNFHWRPPTDNFAVIGDDAIRYLLYIGFVIMLTQFYINFSRQEHQIELL